MLVIDAANVIGSRPTGWWRDRPGAARQLGAAVRGSVGDGRLRPPVILVLEGRFRHGAEEGATGGVEVVHAPAHGDDTIVSVAAQRSGAIVVTADRELAERVRAVGGDVRGPRWLLDRV